MVERAVSMQTTIPYLIIYLTERKQWSVQRLIHAFVYNSFIYNSQNLQAIRRPSTEKSGPINTVELPARNKKHTHVHEPQNVMSGRNDTGLHADDSMYAA